MTEDEAKTKWCPFYRVPTAWEDDGRREAREIGEQSCIASKCMAWRGEPIMTTNDDSKIVCRTDGYCGLAGKP